MTRIVEAHGLGRRFASSQGEVAALMDVTLSLSAGRFIAVQGPSGCGKSTLLNLIGTLDSPSDGDLRLADIDVAALSDTELARFRRDHIAFLFQDAGLIERMTVENNVALPLEYRHRSRSHAVDLARDAIDRMGLSHRTHALIDTLSGGERQRVGLARVLALSPAIIVCDEPTASLDEANSRLVVDHLVAAADGGALVVCASHDPLVLDRADERLRLAHGRLVEPAP